LYFSISDYAAILKILPFTIIRRLKLDKTTKDQNRVKKLDGGPKASIAEGTNMRLLDKILIALSVLIVIATAFYIYSTFTAPIDTKGDLTSLDISNNPSKHPSTACICLPSVTEMRPFTFIPCRLCHKRAIGE
jgi:hypothetical protein